MRKAEVFSSSQTPIKFHPNIIRILKSISRNETSADKNDSSSVAAAEIVDCWKLKIDNLIAKF